MKVLYMPGYRYPGSLKEPLTSGDLRYSFTLSRALAELGHNVTVISRKDSGDKVEQTIDKVRVIRYKSELARIFSTSFDISLRRFLLFRKHYKQADLIICNSPLSLEHMLRIRAPIIYVASGLEDVKNYSLTAKEIIGFLAIKLLRDPLKRLTWRRSLLVNTTAKHEHSTLLDWGIPKNKIGTISSSVDTKRFRPIKKTVALRNKLQLDNKTQVILSVSRFTPAKGILETIKAFEKIEGEVCLLLVGVQHSHDPAYYNRVLDAAQKSPKHKQIKIKENVADAELPVYYSIASVTTVFSKMYDPLPTVIIESMACGTPVVSTYYETRKQFISDGKTGVFVREGDINDWVEKMTKLLDNKALRDSIAKSGLESISKHFDSVNIAKKYIRIVNE